jgi:lysozyme
MKRLSLALLLVAGAGIGVFQGFKHGWLRFNYPSAGRYPFVGVDVSHHRGSIRWADVRSQGIAFAYVKATEGADFVDPLFRENWANARATGLAVGAYHFFTFCSDGASQADNFLATVPRAANSLPPAVDLEFNGNCAWVPDWSDLSQQLGAFLETLRRAYGREPVLYMTREFYDAYLRNAPDHFPSSPLWVRDLYRSPHWLGKRPWTVWQYANNGRVRGIDGLVDLNVFRGDAMAWTAFRGTWASSEVSVSGTRPCCD